MDKTIIKGFPTQISEEIELPPISELLTYPIFFDMPVDQAYRYGTEFQRKILEKTPIRGGKRHISMLSEVKFLDLVTRSCTGFNKESARNADLEWHIDTEEREDGYVGGYAHESDIVHLLSSDVVATTEFNEHDIEIDFPVDRSMNEFVDYLHQNWDHIGIKPKRMPPNRIVTFTNHMHRATAGQTLEFRYMCRIVETDRLRPPSMHRYDKNYITRVIDATGNFVPNIQQLPDRIIIYLPKSVATSIDYRPGPDIKLGEEINKELTPEEFINAQHPHNMQSRKTKRNTEMKELHIEGAFWENNAIAFSSTLQDFTPENSIMLIAYQDFSDPDLNRNLDIFFENVNTAVVLKDSKGQELSTVTYKNFFDIDAFLGPITGTYIIIRDEDLSFMRRGEEYEIIFPETEYQYTINKDFRFIF